MLRTRLLSLAPLLLSAALAAACSSDDSATSSGDTGAGGGSGGGETSAGGQDGPSSTAASSVTTGQGGSGDGGAGPGSGGQGGSSSTGDPESDSDGDGFTELEGDCNDADDAVNPDAIEVCNLVDDDCDGDADEDFDVDGDGFSTCGLDCDDARAEAYPGAAEVQNGLDDDCNGVADEPWADGDGDGFTPASGDCDDLQPEINPNALEFVGNDADDDCDGVVDEALAPCDGGALDAGNPLDYARAMGLCNGELQGATFVSGQAGTRAISASYGTFAGALNVPTEGTKIVHLSSGLADSSLKQGGYTGDGCVFAHPQPLGDPPGDCAAADPATVCDKTEIELQIRVPSNALSFSYQFQFFSAEYRQYRCTQFDDTFLALLSSQALNGGAPTNISFDTNGSVISVNTGFFDICYDHLTPPANLCSIDPQAPLDQTGFDFNNAAATRPLTTTSPVVPGEIITLRFVIFDEGDPILDSSVLLDNFQWSLDPADGPSTGEN